MGTVWGYVFLGIAFSNVPLAYQWMLALITPIFREFWTWISPKVCFKAAGTGPEENSGIKLLPRHYMETKHAVFLAVILGGVATPESTYCILALDTLINLYQSVKIAIQSKQGWLTKEKRKSI